MPGERWHIAEPLTIVIDEPVTHLNAGGVDGRLDIVVTDEPHTRVEVTRLKGRPMDLVLDGGELRLHYPTVREGGLAASLRGMVSQASADIAISVPRSTLVEASMVSGELFVAGAGGRLRVSTISGQLIIDGAEGDVRARTVSGDLTARAIAGSCDMSTVSGSITATGAIGRVRFDAVAGDVTLDTSVPNAEVIAKSVSGNVAVRWPGGAPLWSSISTLAGKQVIGQWGPDDERAFRLTVKTTSGRVTVVEADGGAPGLSAPAAEPGGGQS